MHLHPQQCMANMRLPKAKIKRHTQNLHTCSQNARSSSDQIQPSEHKQIEQASFCAQAAHNNSNLLAKV